MKVLKGCYIALFFVLFVLTAHASGEKTEHVVKVKVKWNNKIFVSYALVKGEFFYYSDSLLQVYRTSPKIFTKAVNDAMNIHQVDTISFYSQVYQIKEEGIILLPKDKELKIARSQIEEMEFIKYLPSEHWEEQVFSEILSSDSTWLSWKIADKEFFSSGGTSGMCGHTIFYFNKPDDASHALVKRFRAAVDREQHNDAVPALPGEVDKFRKRFRKFRIVVIYYCGC